MSVTDAELWRISATELAEAMAACALRQGKHCRSRHRSPGPGAAEGGAPTAAAIDELELRTRVGEVLSHWPVAGLAVGLVRGGSLAWFLGHGVADTGSGTPMDQDTVFRIASVTKTITAVAVMQLQEQGLVDLDAPASGYLRAYRLIPAKPGWRPATLRHLLTHTAGVRAVRTPSDLLRPVLGWGIPAGHPVPSLAEYYQGGLRIDTEPGTRWAYSNHGFATLGQIVADVTGVPLGRYLREHVFGPLGMQHTDLVRSGRVRPRLATGYQLGARGLTAVTDREMVPAGAGAVYSTTSDMARRIRHRPAGQLAYAQGRSHRIRHPAPAPAPPPRGLAHNGTVLGVSGPCAAALRPTLVRMWVDRHRGDSLVVG